MRNLVGYCFVFLVGPLLLQLLPNGTATAQTLIEQLSTEAPEQLAAAIREQGDPIRGALLFNQRDIACGRCHASGGQHLLGPDLSRIADDVADQQIIESVLHPSRVIKEGFETVSLLTIDGRVINGRLIEQDESTFVCATTLQTGHC